MQLQKLAGYEIEIGDRRKIIERFIRGKREGRT
jgi:hypothetical protein